MFAVIKTGGKQYSVAAGDTITVRALEGAPGDKITFDEVLMIAGEGSHKIGAPTVAGAKVLAEIAAQTRSPKSIAFKKRRRQNSKRKRGHRQDLTLVKISSIEVCPERAFSRPSFLIVSMPWSMATFLIDSAVAAATVNREISSDMRRTSCTPRRPR
jgi:large subunit ribosomal protein L21